MSTLFFDIEAGGKKADLSSIYSISAQRGTQSKSFYATPVTGSKWSKWTKEQIWDRISGKPGITSEKQLLSDWMGHLREQKKAGVTTLAGWNIGQELQEQRLSGGPRGYDIPFMLRRSQVYGMQGEMKDVLSQFKIRDIGTEYAYKVSRAAARDKLGVVNPDLKSSASKYYQSGMHLRDWGTGGGSEAARIAAREFSVAGWKQELMYETFSSERLTGAHMSDIDIKASSFLAGKRPQFTPETMLRWNRGAMINKLTSSALAPDAGPDRWASVIGSAREERQRVLGLLGGRQWSEPERRIISSYESLIPDLKANVRSVASERGVSLRNMVRGTIAEETLEDVFSQVAPDVPKAVGGNPSRWSRLIKGVGPKGLAGGAVGVLAAGWAISQFSGRDDAYNTIEGMGHEGIAHFSRREITDFGSPWKGLQSSLSRIFGSRSKSEILGELASRSRPKNISDFRRLVEANAPGQRTIVSSLDPHLAERGLSRFKTGPELVEAAQERPGLAQEILERHKEIRKMDDFRGPVDPMNYASKDVYESAALDEYEAISASPVRSILSKQKAVSTARREAQTVPGGRAQWQEMDLKQAFSGKDDEYNVIEGLGHMGIAQVIRKRMTDFGSGYRGLPESLMGQEIDPRILQFRAGTLDDPSARSKMDEMIAEAQREASAKLGKFAPSDFTAFDPATVAGMNARLTNLSRVNLENFVVNVEDADTLLLRRKGASNWMKSLVGAGKEISIRLAGIDAPEVAGHGNDPLAPFRIWQNQPHGQTATSILRKSLEANDDAYLVVSRGRQTYNRYLGAVIGNDNQNINLELLQQGAVTALPFGDSREDIVKRSAAGAAEQEAIREKRGVWQYARYQAMAVGSREIGRTITHNTLTGIHKLAGNLNLGAYGSWLGEMGEQKREITWSEVEQAKRFGRSLRKSHGPRKSRVRQRTNRGGDRERQQNMSYNAKVRNARRKLMMQEMSRNAQVNLAQASRNGGKRHQFQSAGGFVN